MTSYLVTIATDHHLLVSKCARGMNEQLLKTSGIDVLSFRKKTPKNLMGGAGVGSTPAPSLVRPRVKSAGTSRLIKLIYKERYELLTEKITTT